MFTLNLTEVLQYTYVSTLFHRAGEDPCEETETLCLTVSVFERKTEVSIRGGFPLKSSMNSVTLNACCAAFRLSLQNKNKNVMQNRGRRVWFCRFRSVKVLRKFLVSGLIFRHRAGTSSRFHVKPTAEELSINSQLSSRLMYSFTRYLINITAYSNNQQSYYITCMGTARLFSFPHCRAGHHSRNV